MRCCIFIWHSWALTGFFHRVVLWQAGRSLLRRQDYNLSSQGEASRAGEQAGTDTCSYSTGDGAVAYERWVSALQWRTQNTKPTCLTAARKPRTTCSPMYGRAERGRPWLSETLTMAWGLKKRGWHHYRNQRIAGKMTIFREILICVLSMSR